MKFLASLMLAAVLALSAIPAHAATINRMTVDYANGSYLRYPSNYVLARSLAASTAESITVPTDDATGKKARSVVLSSTCDLYVNTTTTATVPGDTTDGSASILNPVGLYLGGAITTISVITPDAACVVTAEFFM